MDGTADNRLDPPGWDIRYHPLTRLHAALREEAATAAGPIADVGCGAKPYGSLFGTPYFGVDLRSQHGRPDVLGVAEAVPFRDGSCSTVVSTQNLEHVDSPELVLREARRVLRPGGRLLLSTHGVWVHHPDPHDRWRWTEEGLVDLIESFGFRVERVHAQGGSVLAGALLAAYPLRHFAERSGARATVARSILRGVNVVAGRLDAALERRAPRQLASVGYLVAAVALDG